jgi:hypothetical protein
MNFVKNYCKISEYLIKDARGKEISLAQDVLPGLVSTMHSSPRADSRCYSLTCHSCTEVEYGDSHQSDTPMISPPVCPDLVLTVIAL